MGNCKVGDTVLLGVGVVEAAYPPFADVLWPNRTTTTHLISELSYAEFGKPENVVAMSFAAYLKVPETEHPVIRQLRAEPRAIKSNTERSVFLQALLLDARVCEAVCSLNEDAHNIVSIMSDFYNNYASTLALDVEMSIDFYDRVTGNKERVLRERVEAARNATKSAEAKLNDAEKDLASFLAEQTPEA